ncbi:hypothetical protein HK101_004629, partial [Irineochytrium annulatum]
MLRTTLPQTVDPSNARTTYGDILAVNAPDGSPPALAWGNKQVQVVHPGGVVRYLGIYLQATGEAGMLAKLTAAVDGVLDLLRPKVVTDKMVAYCLQKIVGARLKYMWTGHYLASVWAQLTRRCRTLFKQKAG